jgi:hypothetical protein
VIGRLAQDQVVDHHGGIGRKQRAMRQLAQDHGLLGAVELGAGDAGDVVQRGFAGQHALVDFLVGEHQFEIDADLAQQFAAARAFRGEIDFVVRLFH